MASLSLTRTAAMRSRLARKISVLLTLCGTALLLSLLPRVNAKDWFSNSSREPSTAPQGSVLNGHAVMQATTKQTPEIPDDVDDGGSLSLTLLEREYHGDLEAKSKGHSLALATNVEGSVTVVTMERITGKLQGRKGSFVIERHVVTKHGVPDTSIVVVQDSGSGQLAGIAGKIVPGQTPHTFDFYYILPTPQKQ